MTKELDKYRGMKDKNEFIDQCLNLIRHCNDLKKCNDSTDNDIIDQCLNIIRHYDNLPCTVNTTDDWLIAAIQVFDRTEKLKDPEFFKEAKRLAAQEVEVIIQKNERRRLARENDCGPLGDSE